MLAIGVVGDDKEIVLGVLADIFMRNGIPFFASVEKDGDGVAAAFIEAVKQKAKVVVLSISGNDWEKISTLRFDIFVFLVKKEHCEVVLSSLLKRRNILIVNNDVPLPEKISTNGETTLITCGFNHTSSVTVSSVGEFADKIQYCLQRTLLTLNGEAIEPQEFSVCGNSSDITEVLAAVTAAIISGAEV
jgi:hypothetical protein